MSDIFQFQVGSGATALRYSLRKQGDGLSIAVEGGRSHIGSVAVVIDKKIKVITGNGHKDDFLVRPIAEEIGSMVPGTLVVMAGFHLDNITPGEIESVLEHNREGLRRLREYLVDFF